MIEAQAFQLRCTVAIETRPKYIMTNELFVRITTRAVDKSCSLGTSVQQRWSEPGADMARRVRCGKLRDFYIFDTLWNGRVRESSRADREKEF